MTAEMDRSAALGQIGETQGQFAKLAGGIWRVVFTLRGGLPWRKRALLLFLLPFVDLGRVCAGILVPTARFRRIPEWDERRVRRAAEAKPVAVEAELRGPESDTGPNPAAAGPLGTRAG